MTREHYNPVPLNVSASKKRWSKDAAFADAYNALADEFAALRHYADAVGCELQITLAPKPKALHRNLTR